MRLFARDGTGIPLNLQRLQWGPGNEDGKNTDSHLLVEKLLKKSQRDVVQLGTSPSAATPVSAAAKKTTGPASSTPVSASHASSQANLSTGTSTGHDQTTLQSNEVTQSLPPTPSPRPASLFCDFELNLCGWENCRSGDFNWLLRRERLAEFETQTLPDGHASCRNFAGEFAICVSGLANLSIAEQVPVWQYLYMEAAFPRESGQTAVLISPVFKGPKCLSFWYHLIGDGVGELDTAWGKLSLLYVAYVSSPDSWHKLWSASGAMPRRWSFQQLDLFVTPEEEFQRCWRRCSVTLRRGCAAGTSDDFDWELHQERLPPLLSATQPDSQGKCRNFEGQYLYMEAAFPRESGQTAVLLSPVFKGPKCLSFWYSLFGNGVGSLSVYMQYVSKAGIWHKLWSVGGNKSRKWHLADLELFVDPNETFQTAKSTSGAVALGEHEPEHVCTNCHYGKNTDSHLLVEKLLKESQRDVVRLSTSPSVATPVSAAAKETTSASSQANLSTGTSSGHDQTTLQSKEVTQSLPPTPSSRPASLFCDFELTLCGWENCRSGDFNWLLRRERPAEFETHPPPDGHASCRNFAGESAIWQYLYMEAAFPRESGQTAVLISPVFKGPKCLSFWYSLFGDGVEVLETLFCDFEKGLCGWSQCTSDEFDWELHQERLPPLLSATQPDSQGKCRNFEGQYLYMEAAFPRESGQTAVLISPVFKGPKCLSFWYSLFGDGVGSLSVYMQYVSTAGIWHKLWSVSGNKSRKWHLADLELFVDPNETFQIILEGTIGNNPCGDVGVDDVFVTGHHCGKGEQRAPCWID
ncbi:UNVERIFIED_CONTAM: hypothetical protein FKN15_030203 [Acipenser sinensis]